MAQAGGSLAPHLDLLELAGPLRLSHNWKPFVYVVRAVSPHTEKLTPRCCLFFQWWEAEDAIVISLSSEGISQCAPRLILWGALEQRCSFRIIPNKEKGTGLYLSVSHITGCGNYSQKRGCDFEEGLSLQPETIPREALSADLLVINAAEVGGWFPRSW